MHEDVTSQQQCFRSIPATRTSHTVYRLIDHLFEDCDLTLWIFAAVSTRFPDRNPELTRLPVDDPRAIYPSYKGLSANESPFKRLQRYYDARAEDQSRIFYTFPRSRMSIYIIVHKRVPVKDFRTLLVQFFKEKSTKDVVGNDDVEIRVVSRAETDQNPLDDEMIAGTDDAGDDSVEVEEG